MLNNNQTYNLRSLALSQTTSENGNSLKRTGRDRDGWVIILLLTTVEEHIAIQRESKARTTLLQSIPDDHMRKSMLKQEFLEFKTGEAKGLHKGYDRIQKILSQLNQLKAKPEDEDINLKFLRALPSSWSHDAGDAGEFALMGVTSEVHNCLFGCDNKYNELKKQYNELNEQNSEYFIQVQAYKNSLKTLEKQKRVLQRNQLTLEDKIRVLSIELENTSNLLKHSEKINADVETTKKDLQTKLDNHLVETEKWRNSSKNLLVPCLAFTTNSEDVEGRSIFHRFAKVDSMKVVPSPLSRDYTSLSDPIDLDESQMSYGTKSSTSSDSKSVSNDFVSCDNSDKSSKVNINDFASNDSSVKSSEPKPNDSTSCASTSSDLPSFSCNSSKKNKNTSRTSCNKNDYFNKKAGHFRKNASSVCKLCFVCGSGTHLIKDCDFYEKQIANKTVGIGVGLEHYRDKVNHQSQFVPQAVLLRTGKVNIPPARPQPVSTGKPKVFAPVPASRQNRPFSVPTDRGYSPSTYTPYVPTMSYNHMKYGGDRWATPVKPSAVQGEDLSLWVFNSLMLHLLRIEMVINSPWIMPIFGTQELASPEQTAPVNIGRLSLIPTGRVLSLGRIQIVVPG
nr:hypothetical protein [Tanacetum cinerariifolium]